MFDNLESIIDGTEVIFKDFIMLILLFFIILFAVAFPHINPVAKDETDEIRQSGTIAVELFWPDPINADLDLWVQAPGQSPIGFSRKSGLIFNLVRDDLGHSSDPSGNNSEISFARGTIAGEYIINVHFYRNSSPENEVTGTINITIRNEKGDKLKEIRARFSVIPRQELTVLRFSMDGEGKFVENSINDFPKQLYLGRMGTR